MMNLVTNRLSNMAFVEIYTDLDIQDEFLTQRTLTDAAYRETELEKLRDQLNWSGVTTLLCRVSVSESA